MADPINIKMPGNWAGVPYSQGTTWGPKLSPYANLVDQIYDSQQPMPVGRQMGRWNFGWPQGGPPIAQGQAGGLLSRQAAPPPPAGGLLSGAPQPNIQGGTAPQPGAVAPSGTATGRPGQASFAQPQQATPQGANAGAWRNFTFQNPTSPFQQNFNYLAGINPDLAFAYGFSPASYNANEHNTLAGALNSQYGTGGAIINAFTEGVPASSVMGQNLGLQEGWSAPKVTFGPSGTMTANGQTYKLPHEINYGQFLGWANQPGADWSQQDIAYAKANAEKAQKTAAATEAAQIGSPNWWAAVNAARGG